MLEKRKRQKTGRNGVEYNSNHQLFMFCVTIICITRLLANAAAMPKDIIDNDLSLWEKFEWKLTLMRSRQDEFVLEGFLDEKEVEDKIKRIVGATCNYTSAEMSSLGRKNAFEMHWHCKCDWHSSSFMPSLKRCIRNKEFKKDCRYTTGSWRWQTGWTWDAMDDALMVLDHKEGQGITTAFNATANEHDTCTVRSISEMKDNRTWVKIRQSHLNGSGTVIFKLKDYWHISWSIEDLDSDAKRSIEGKILKFEIECATGEINEEEKVLIVSSCLVFKVSGRLQFSSRFKDTSSKQPTAALATTPTREHSPTGSTEENKNRKIIILVVIVVAITLAIVVIIVFYCLRRKRHLASKDFRANLTVKEDAEPHAPMLGGNNEQHESFV